VTSASVVAAALRQYDIDPKRVEPLADSFNTLFTVDTGTDRYVLRVGPPSYVHESGAAGAEARWTDELSALGLTVPRVIRSKEGASSVLVDDDGEARVCTLSSWVDGETLSRPMAPADAMALGELAARLHTASAPRSARPDGALDGRHVLLFCLPDLLGGAPYADVFTAARDRAQSALDRLWAAAGTPRLMHGDLIPANVVRTRKGLVPIDFQDLFWGHREQDIAITLFSCLRDDDDGTLAECVRTGYERELAWPEFDVIGLDDLYAGRRLMMANLAMALDRTGRDEYLTVHADALRRYLANG
jgi:Ser/Thr protein kinase RdoA (MazF antagonist)